MQHEKDNGIRTYSYEQSPIDKIIDLYEQRARKHILKVEELEQLPPDVRQKRKRELDQALKHLEHERRHAENMIDIQSDLELYRERGRKATQGTRSQNSEMQRALAQEEHHPTDTLEKYMRADGKPKPSSNHTAHHIVPGKGKTKEANRARLRMHRYGIRINDPDNGVWLPRYAKNTPHWSMPNSKGHLQYHTHNYERWVNQAIQAKSSESGIRMQLTIIGKQLQDGTYPKEIMESPK